MSDKLNTVIAALSLICVIRTYQEEKMYKKSLLITSIRSFQEKLIYWSNSVEFSVTEAHWIVNKISDFQTNVIELNSSYSIMTDCRNELNCCLNRYNIYQTNPSDENRTSFLDSIKKYTNEMINHLK